jgi:hypothetical protein
VIGLDLSHPRSFGALFATTFGVWFRYFPVFFTLAIVPVAPAVVLIDGLWVGKIHDPSAGGSVFAGLASFVISGLIVPSLVTAVHVLAVQDLGDGRRPRIGASFRAAAGYVLPLSLVVVLYSLSVLAGLVLLIVGAIYFAVRLYFAAQAVVVDGRRGTEAIARSSEVVAGHWWRAFAIVGLIFIFDELLYLPLRMIDDGVVYTMTSVFSTALVLSFTALAGTLLYFDLLARRS